MPELVDAGPRREGRRGPGLPGGHPARRPPAQHPGDVGGVPRGLPRRQAAAAGRRRPALRRGDGRRARRRPGLRPRHHPRRGRQLPRPPHHATPGRHPDRVPTRVGTTRHPPPLRAVLPRPLRRQPRRRRLLRSACSATSPPSCASAPTATRACSRPTPTCSSGPRSAPATCSRSTASWSGRHPVAVMDFTRARRGAAAPATAASRRAEVLDPPCWRPTAPARSSYRPTTD